MIKTPFKVHVFICQNTRPDDPERQSCGGPVSANLREKLKDFVDENGLKTKVRVTSTNCLGPCAKGPNVMVYPQELYFSKCTEDSFDEIKSEILKALGV